MIVIRGQGLCVLLANLTNVSRVTDIQRSLCFFCAVLPNEVYEKIRLRQRALEIATRYVTFHEFFVLFTMLCAFV